MAESPSHRFGQIVGTFLEEILLAILLKFCTERDLYLDRHGERTGVRSGRKVAWDDKYGNTHDLDFVIEKGGSPSRRGRPVAFIEVAWRRYTKHSRNKAQEIQGAVLPIAEKYERDIPFLGAILAGVFTKGSLDQLRSMRFEIVYLPYDTITDAFSSVGIDAQFDEDTADAEFAKCIRQIEALPAAKLQKLKDHLVASNKDAFDAFFRVLRAKLDRILERVVVLPLFGTPTTFSTVIEAEQFIEHFDAEYAAGEFQNYELIVVFSNKDEIKGTFRSKDYAKEFLRYFS